MAQTHSEEVNKYGAEIIDFDSENDLAIAGHEDQLSTVLLERRKRFVPSSVVYAAEAICLTDREKACLDSFDEDFDYSDFEYCEVYTEVPVNVNGHVGDKVANVLIDAELAERANAITGSMEQVWLLDDQFLELRYIFKEVSGSMKCYYEIRLNGRYVQHFKSFEIAEVLFGILIDRKESDYRNIIKRAIRAFNWQAHNLDAFDMQKFVAYIHNG